jgi:hypothetical protein
MQRPGQVDCEHGVPVLERQLVDLAAPVESGVVDQYVDAAPGLGDGRSHA